MAEYDYDLFTIGAGSGGVRASRLAATYGARVGLAEEYRVGGTCVIRGCVPKKYMVFASEYGHGFNEARGYGWQAENVSFDWSTLIKNKDDEIDRLNGIYIKNLKKVGVEIIQSRAIIKDEHTVHLVGENRDVTAKRILIATGGTPWRDESVPGNELGITSNEVFHLSNMPSSIVINGGGYIAIEFACIFKGLGADVTLVYRGDTLLRHFDHDVSAQLKRELEAQGIDLRLGVNFEKIEDLGSGKKRVTLTNGDAIDTAEVFWGTGRKPAINGLGLENAGVEIGKNGAIIVDDKNQTSNPNIFAVGDVTDRVALTPVAIREGAAFAETFYNDTPTTTDYTFIPKAVFSQPPVGTVGYSEAEARDAFDKVDIYRTEFRPMKNIISGSPARVLIKLVVDAASDKVVGCHIVGDEAGEMIQCVAIAVKAGVTKAQFDDTVALHPTIAEEMVTLRSKVAD